MKKIHLLCLMATLVLCTNYTTTTAIKVPKWLVGHWIGVGYQINFGNSWTMALDVGNNGETIIEYPSIPCNGVWIMRSAKRDKAVFQEIIEQKSICSDKGQVVVTKVDDNHITFTYFREGESIANCFSTLVRREFAKGKLDEEVQKMF
jgi:hypothetical protein